VGCTERVVLYFRELLFKSNKNKFSFTRVESEKIGREVYRERRLNKKLTVALTNLTVGFLIAIEAVSTCGVAGALFATKTTCYIRTTDIVEYLN